MKQMLIRLDLAALCQGHASSDTVSTLKTRNLAALNLTALPDESLGQADDNGMGIVHSAVVWQQHRLLNRRLDFRFQVVQGIASSTS